MNIEIIKSDKNDIELKIDNITVAEILRVYLNNQGIDFAAWRREHPDSPIVFKIKSTKGTVKEAVKKAVIAIKKDSSAISSIVK